MNIIQVKPVAIIRAGAMRGGSSNYTGGARVRSEAHAKKRLGHAPKTLATPIILIDRKFC